MEPWVLFRKFRTVLFAVISVISLLWAILLSVYLAREWKHGEKAQRIIVLLMICGNVFTSVLLYLMIVVMFQLWLDFSRIVFLFALHFVLAVLLSIFGHKFDCTVFGSRDTCDSVYDFALFIVWSMVTLFVVHAVVLGVMSRIPRPEPDMTEKLVSETSSEKPRGDIEENIEPDPDSPDSVVSQAERVQAAPARLVVMEGASRPVYIPPPPRKLLLADSARGSYGTMDPTDYLPTLPYGASSLEGFMTSSSPAPSYTSQDPVFSRPPQSESRFHPRPFHLDQNALSRSGSVSSVATVDSVISAYNQLPDSNAPARPTLAVVAQHRRSASLGARSFDTLPPQLRPGTPLGNRSPSPALNAFAAQVHTRTRTATLDSIHSVVPSLLFMEGEASPARAHMRANSNSSTRSNFSSSSLSRQPTVKLHLPNPYDTADEPPVPQRSGSLDLTTGSAV
ncbi:hypothetical protein WOLCODRAFT_136046 [Wolfiporia cocos MD-104 SS10]|uniref:Uncharacterized protein n=1 Tax=Wolfiporia cocos (strain MD-104) TaxID=742152 RepID=A0A2H3J842_WOLCO|nr:hypothetical protein WOLCODRAFT_136046 [Wolfiporia cocos MD-104 SS10]